MYGEYNKDRQADYLTILVWHTVFFAMFAAVTFFLDWDKAVLVFLAAVNIGCWVLHFMSRVPDKYKTWIYFFTGMMLFFFYGSHSTSLWDMTAVHVFIQLLYYRNRQKRMIAICTVVYFFTLLCNLLLGARTGFDISALNISRLALHCIIVISAARIAMQLISRELQSISDVNREIHLLEEMNHRTVDFLSNVSHEFRTPINVITGISAASLKAENDPERRRSIIFMRDAGKKLFSLVDEILDYAEISSGKSVLFEDEYVFLSLANDIVAESRVMQVSGNVELIFDVDTSIPSVLAGDSKKIKKALRLLIDNALKFTRLGAVYVKIRALPKSYGVNLCMEVRDTGKGIEEENISKIASRFYQGNNERNRSTGGLGLGLPIAYGLVSAMKGFIRVESEIDRGTTFTISVPQRVVDSSPAISFSRQSKVAPALFIRMEKYTLPEVKFFFNETILHMVHGLEIPLYRAFGLEELKRLVATKRFTHLFVGKEELDEDREYFESLIRKMAVIVIADAAFSLPPESGIKVLRKPLWALPVVNAISAGLAVDIFSDKKTRMVCPDVKILVVDDEPMNLMITEGLLKDYLMKVSLAESGKRAIEMCESEAFDIIFLDHMMPDMDGIETMRRLKIMAAKAGAVLRVVAFTANAISSAREMFIKEGFAEFLSKPVEVAELERVLKKVLPSSMIAYVDEDSRHASLLATVPADASPPRQEDSQRQDLAAARSSDGIELLERCGINAGEGLSYCRGDRGFYRELLLKFASDAPEKEKKIEGFYEACDFENYRILVHVLKSTAKMIGADSLSDAAKGMEEAAKNNEVQYIEKNHSRLMLQYSEVAEAITGAFGKEAAKSRGFDPAVTDEESPDGEAFAGGKDVVSKKEEISKEEFLLKLDELKKRLATFEADRALALIDSMAAMSFGGKPVAAMLEGARQDVDSFEFSAAKEKLELLILDAEGGG